MFATLGGCFLRETFATSVETQGLLELAVCLKRICVEVNLEAWDLSRLLEIAFFLSFCLFFFFLLNRQNEAIQTAYLRIGPDLNHGWEMTRLATVGWIEQARIIKPVNSWSVADAKQHRLEFDRARKRPKKENEEDGQRRKRTRRRREEEEEVKKGDCLHCGDGGDPQNKRRIPRNMPDYNNRLQRTRHRVITCCTE